MSTESTKTIKGRISNKHGTEVEWYAAGTAANPFIPLSGELIIYDPDDIYGVRTKIGDGQTPVHLLPWASGCDETVGLKIEKQSDGYYYVTGFDEDFVDAINIKELIIPRGFCGEEVKGVYDWAFEGCNWIEKVFIPSTVTEGMYEPFYGRIEVYCEAESRPSNWYPANSYNFIWGATKDIFKFNEKIGDTTALETESKEIVGAINEVNRKTVPATNADNAGKVLTINDSGAPEWQGLSFFTPMTWYMNENIDTSVDATYEIDFEVEIDSDIRSYSVILIQDGELGYAGDGGYTAYNDNGSWTTNSARKITITGGVDAENSSLNDWFNNNAICLLAYQSKGVVELETTDKTIVGAINEINKKTVDKITEVHNFYGDTKSYLKTDDTAGIQWQDHFAFINSNLKNITEGTLYQRVPISAGENVTFEVDETNNVVKINASVPSNGSEGLEYTLSDDETYYIVTGMGTCTDEELIIPSVYNGLPVKEIGDSAFEFVYNSGDKTEGVTSGGNNLHDIVKKVIIPNSVTRIGNNAFAIIDEDVVEGYTSTLEYVDMANSVLECGEGAFSRCLNLKKIKLSNQLSAISDYTFYACENLVDIVIPDSVTSIGIAAFWGPQLTNINIPNSITSIEDEAFWFCPIKNLIIPKSVIHMGRDILGDANDYDFEQTIYCEDVSQPAGWSLYWNGTSATVVWGFANDFAAVHEKISDHQPQTDETLKTESKEIVGAINEVNDKIGIVNSGDGMIGTWVFNDELNLNNIDAGDMAYEIKFTCNSINYGNMYFIMGDIYYYLDESNNDGPNVYSNSEWVDEVYKTITITEEPPAEIGVWIKENAKKQGGLDTTSKTIVGAINELNNKINESGSVNGLEIVTTTGTGMAYEATVGGITELNVGASFVMIPHITSSTGSPSLNVNGLGAKGIRRGSNVLTSIAIAGSSSVWLQANYPCRVMYNGNYWIAVDMTQPDATDLINRVPVANGGVPPCDSSNNDQFLRVINGVPTWATVLNAEEASF